MAASGETLRSSGPALEGRGTWAQTEKQQVCGGARRRKWERMYNPTLTMSIEVDRNYRKMGGR